MHVHHKSACLSTKSLLPMVHAAIAGQPLVLNDLTTETMDLLVGWRQGECAMGAAPGSLPHQPQVPDL